MSASPVVLGLYDIPSYGLTKDQWISMWGKTDTELDFFIEPYGFEAMDGVITSVHCIDAGKALHEKYESTVPMIEFLAYPCEEFIPTAGSKYSDEDGKIHLVYGGHVSPSNLPKEIFGDVQFHPLIDKITKQGMIFEMYPTPYMSPIRVKEIFADYINLAAANPLFKYYPDVSFKDALRQAARCDFGLMAYLFEKGCYGEDHTRWVIPTKFYKFIEVGLPIVVSEEVQHIAQLVREYDIGVVVSQKDLDNLVEILSAVDRRKLAANVRRARESMSVRRHIKSLVDFYAEAVDHRQKVMTSKLFGGG
ncbi:MAG: hypothetical protein JW384_01644 [Nitrosomonadaceae bacterium]|nr:hypothetical protein [Nitrosomonadaceae bacterium]